jgi:tetratricopeptide (TPR) repeat protein
MRTLVLSVLLTGVVALASNEVPVSEETDRLSQQAKSLYDQGLLEDALKLYQQCQALEPRRARWPYSVGLTLKKLHRAGAAEAFQAAQALEPDYKRAEIEEKLSELHAVPTSPRVNRGTPSWVGQLLSLLGCLGVAALMSLVFKRLVSSSNNVNLAARQRGGNRPAPRPYAVDPAALQQAEAKLAALSPRLTQCERALGLGDDEQARNLMDRAWANVQACQRTLARAKHGEASLDAVELALLPLRAVADAAEQRLRSLYGTKFDEAPTPSVGCFFCARPLGAPSSRHTVSLQEQGHAVEVTACTACRRTALTGEAPQVTTVQGQHWSQAPGFDPAVACYQATPPVQHCGPWELGPFGTLATLAGGVALGAVATEAVIDLVAARHAGLARQAAAASAQSAHRSQERSWKDHS